MITSPIKHLQGIFTLKKSRVFLNHFSYAFLVILMALVVVAVSFEWWFADKLLPGSLAYGVDLSGHTKQEAVQKLDSLTNNYLQRFDNRLALSSNATTSAYLEIPLKELEVDYLLPKLVDRLYQNGRRGSIQDRLFARHRLLSGGINIQNPPILNSQVFDVWLSATAKQLDQPGVPPKLVINKEGVVEFVQGVDGLKLDKASLEKQLVSTLTQLDPTPLSVQMTTDTQTASHTQQLKALEKANKLLGKKLTVQVKKAPEPNTWNLTDADMIGFVDVLGDYNQSLIQEYIDSLAESVNHPPTEALFKFEDGKVSEFRASQEGVTLNSSASALALVNQLKLLEVSPENNLLELVVSQTPPQNTTPEVNNLGIESLIGRGESSYVGSIPGRVHNVALTASKLNGVLVAPGETFSFNKTIGEVSRATGYQASYVIKGGRTVLGDGGGVCQDSTTLFRAVLDAGLPITERRAHSYRVGYYEQGNKPGFDATVYSPTTDFKFVNDTPGHILIQTNADTVNKTLTIELYGTNDGRVAEISNYTQWDSVPAPPPIYQDDPSLSSGQIKQVDWAAPGLKVKFDYKVTKNSQLHFEKTFTSIFKPWQAVYLRGV